MRFTAARLWLASALAALQPLAVAGGADPLAEGFAQPPREARPWVFWQWVNGNVTHSGIRQDLEWMQRIGLGGAILFDIGFRSPPVPQYVETRVGFATPQWQAALQVAAAEAHRLGLLLGAQSSGGWSVSGGPWVPPEQAMKKLVWSELDVTPATSLPLQLPPLPQVSGPYQDVPVDPMFREPERGGEVAVIAYRLSDVEQAPRGSPALQNLPRAELLEDGRYGESLTIPAQANGETVLLARFNAAPRTLTLAAPRGRLPQWSLEASDDAQHFQPITLPRVAVAQGAPVTVVALPQPARYWRLRFTGLREPLQLTEARFDPGEFLDHGPEKAGFGTLRDAEGVTPREDPAAILSPHSLLDLSDQLAADGTLHWRPRMGRWRVQRFGWSLTGRRNVPATPESQGLEVDKLDAGAVRAYAEHFFDLHARAIGNAGGLNLAFTDSWEAGQQNWTPGLLEEFRQRRGYDLRPWLPVLAGRVIGSRAHSERVLADFRRTLSDLLVVNHYGVLADVAHARGMQYAAQAAGTDVPTTLDGIAAKGRTDVPTGEFWIYPEGSAPKAEHLADIREAASAAHLYGKPTVAAEALTTLGELPWAQGPAQWRRMVDRFFTEGVNQVILHTSVHQPFADRVPGMTLRQYGQHFTRHETWAEDAGAWVRYLSRSSWLLQQGHPVADVAVYVADNPVPFEPFAAFTRESPADRLTGHDHDFLNTEQLLQMRARGRRAVLPSGAHYAVLITPPLAQLGAPARQQLRALRRAGVAVVVRSPDRARNARALHRALPAPDVRAASSALRWAHRRAGDAHLYFLSNQSPQDFSGEVEFRVRDLAAELWDATDGSRRPVSTLAHGQTTALTLQLPAYRSAFVIFRGEPAPPAPSRATEARTLQQLAGDWQVEFLDGRGAPRHATLSGSWSQQADPGIRYYSGRARYTRPLRIPDEWLAAGARIELDLGVVGDLAHVQINGHDLGTWWSPPLRADITAALQPGDNTLEIIVTNYWANRLIGDQQPGAAVSTFAPISPYTAGDALRPAGVLGPVLLIRIAAKESL